MNFSVLLNPAQSIARKADPKPLYIQRKLLNGGEFTKWAKSQGFEKVLEESELHVTIVYSREAVDWDAVEDAPEFLEFQGSTDEGMGKEIRTVERLGDKGAVVLKFTSSVLQKRWREWREAGASWDYDEYNPHVTITYNAPEGFDVSKVTPYDGPLEFGPEIKELINDNYTSEVVEKLDFANILKGDVCLPDHAKKEPKNLSTGLKKKKPTASVAKLDFSKVLKHNPYHDEIGRFTTHDKAKFVSVGEKFKAALNNPKHREKEKDYPVADENSDEILKWKADQDQHIETLSSAQKKAVVQYTTENNGGYSDVNHLLREGEMGKAWDEERKTLVATNVELLDEVMSKSTVGKDLTVFRGIQGTKGHELFDFFSNPENIGKVMADKGFSSVTIDHAVAKNWAQVSLHIKVKKETKGIYVESISKYANEKEVILNRGQRLKVTKAYMDGTRKIIEAETLP